MAGSYRHITNDNNEFTGIDLIENLGDAHGALEECYEIIQILAKGKREKKKKKIFEAYRETVARANPEYAADMTNKEYWNDEG